MVGDEDNRLPDLARQDADEVRTVEPRVDVRSFAQCAGAFAHRSP
jgi:hypothetical protein